MYYIQKKKKQKQVLQILFGITGKYNPVYQHSKGNMKRRIIVEVNVLTFHFYSHACVDCGHWVTHTVGETSC